MKVGIISFAHMHAHAYAKYLNEHPDATLSAVWDENAERGKEASKQYGMKYYSDMTAFLETDLDAVIICSENSKHCEHVEVAAKAGKHILCEKPIATSIKDAQKMIDVCNGHSVILQIAFPMRFSPVFIQTKEIIQSGSLGNLLAIKGTNHGQMPGGWFIEKELSGGGAAMDHIVHLMDLIRWMLKDEAKNVYAELDTRLYDIDVEDCGIVSIELDSGVIASIDPSWSRPKTYPMWGNVTMEFVGTKGTLSVDAFKQSIYHYNDSKSQIEQLPWADNPDEGIISDFIQCVQTGGAPSISGEDGLRVLEVVKAAYKSNEIKSVVEL